jgi:hypothetical protein
MNLNHQIPAAEQGMNSYQYIQESLFEEVLKDSNKIMFTNRETEIPHNPYDQEVQQLFVFSINNSIWFYNFFCKSTIYYTILCYRRSNQVSYLLVFKFRHIQ